MSISKTYLYAIFQVILQKHQRVNSDVFVYPLTDNILYFISFGGFSFSCTIVIISFTFLPNNNFPNSDSTDILSIKSSFPFSTIVTSIFYLSYISKSVYFFPIILCFLIFSFSFLSLNPSGYISI